MTDMCARETGKALAHGKLKR